MMSEAGQLSVNDRVLLHLLRFATDVPPTEFPSECTQAGIAAAIGISRTHAPRAVKGLMKQGFVDESRARVTGHERRMSVYAVTAEGVKTASELWRDISNSLLKVQCGDSAESMTGAQIEELVGKKKALAIVSRIKDGVVDIGKKQTETIKMIDDSPEPVEFYGRDDELRSGEDFLRSDSRAMVILGNRGSGTSTIARRLIQTHDETNALWIPLDSQTSLEEILAKLRRFAEKVSGQSTENDRALDLEESVIIFDDFFTVTEEVVEFLTTMIESDGRTKIIVTAREETPAYNWFYHKKHVDDETVRVLRVKGLDEKSAMRLLGNEKIEKDAFRRIFMMSRGQPMILRMLADGDYEGLKKNTVFTTEEARYLLFLKDKKG